jgi:AcrR family transcriptional regulator
MGRVRKAASRVARDVRPLRYASRMKKLHMPHIQITQAALHLYAAEGPKGLTMRSLGRTLGICASALYRHFKNKDAIVEAVVDAAESKLALRLQPSPRRKPPKDRAGFIAEGALTFAIDQPHLFQLVARRKAHWHGEQGSRRAITMRVELTKAMDERQLRRDDVEAVSAALWAQLCGLVALRERGDLPFAGPPLREAWRRTAQRMLRGIRAA